MTTEKTTAVATVPRRSALTTLADRFGVEPNGVFMRSLKSVAFKSPDVTDEQLMALVLVANQYKLNPFTKELYAFPDKGGGIVPIVSIDGWLRIINEHEQFDGLDYTQGVDDVLGIYGECTIYRKDRAHPTKLREYLSEVKRNTDPWKMVSRMLRHKTIIQTSRVAFGFAGIFEPDEAERIIEAQTIDATVVPNAAKGASRLRTLLDASPAPVQAAAPAATVAVDQTLVTCPKCEANGTLPDDDGVLQACDLCEGDGVIVGEKMVAYFEREEKKIGAQVAEYTERKKKKAKDVPIASEPSEANESGELPL